MHVIYIILDFIDLYHIPIMLDVSRIILILKLSLVTVNQVIYITQNSNLVLNQVILNLIMILRLIILLQ